MYTEGKVNNLVIIQARMGASRLPGKVLLPLAGKTVLEHVIERVSRAKLIDDIIVATTIGRENLPILRLCADKGIRVFCGSESDVLDRYYQAAKLLRPVNVIRITADCPAIDPQVIDQVIEEHIREDNDYTSNTLGKETFPDGLDVEIVRFSVLKEAWENARLASEREHVTLYITHSKQYKKGAVYSDVDHGMERWTLDTQQDYQMLKAVFESLYINKKDFTYSDVIDYLDQHNDIRIINKNIERNEGLKKSLDNDYEVNI